SPADIASPIRAILRRQRNVEVLLGEVTGIDLPGRQVRFDGGLLPYDLLVIATGARHGYFGHAQWEKFAPGLKSISDATLSRRRILTAFERAEMEDDPEERAAWMHFVLVGAGPTGVEMAGAIAELAHRALASDFRRIDPKSARITLVEAGPRVLGGFNERLSNRAKADLERLGVEVRLSQRVEKVDAEGVWIAGEL